MTKYDFHELRLTNPKEYFRLRWQRYKKTLDRTKYFRSQNRGTYFKERYRQGKSPQGLSSTNASRARKFKGDKCESCGAVEKLLIHHKDRNQNNNTRENIQTLCFRCHNTLHRNSVCVSAPVVSAQ